jgi:hypothetical protein
MNSTNTAKKLSKSHITEQRFEAYSKARDYVDHLVKFYDRKKDNTIYDETSIMNQVFKDQTPVNSLHKLSIMPKSSVAIELSEKIRLVNAFHNLSERKVKKISFRDKQSKFLSRRSRNTFFTTKKYNSMLTRLKNDLNVTDKYEDSTFITNESKLSNRFETVTSPRKKNCSFYPPINNKH